MRHYWSLSVEEQFYFAWPLIVLGVRRVQERLLRPALLVLIVISLGSMLFGGLDEPARFYSLQTRAWQLLVGAFAAHVAVRARSTSPGPGWWFGSLAAGSVVACVAVAGIDSTRWRGVTTIVLTLATLVVILEPGDVVGVVGVAVLGTGFTLVGDRLVNFGGTDEVVAADEDWLDADELDAAASTDALPAACALLSLTPAPICHLCTRLAATQVSTSNSPPRASCTMAVERRSPCSTIPMRRSGYPR